jgi:HK97 family phage major capsid protein
VTIKIDEVLGGVLNRPIDDLVARGGLTDLEGARSRVVDHGHGVAEAVGDDGMPSEEQAKILRASTEAMKVLDERIAVVKNDQDALAAIREAHTAEEAARAARLEQARSPKYDPNTQQQQQPMRTPGELWVEGDPYKNWIARFPQGGPAQQATAFSDALLVPGFRSVIGLRTATEKLMAMRALVTAADTSAGDLVRADWRGLLEPGLTRPLTVRQLVTVIPTASDAVEYALETARTSGAAPVAEATAVTGTTGLKPEGGLEFDMRTTTVKTIAEWVAATKRILSDANGLREYINAYLLYDVALELEDQMISGSGAGENFTGILNTAGIQTTAVGGAPASAFDAIRQAIRLIVQNARTRPNAVVLHPQDSAEIDLIKINNEMAHFAGPGPFAGLQNPPIWGLQRVESEALPVGTALVGDFRRAILWDREETMISVGTAEQDFIRNIVRVLAEMRAAFTVVRPAAFCTVTGV